jgi:DNA-binding response OmpR family regulator
LLNGSGVGGYALIRLYSTWTAHMSQDKRIKVLLVGRDELFGDSMKMYLNSKGFEVWATETFEAGLEHLSRIPSDLIISEHGRSSTEALRFFGELNKLRLAPQAYKIIICDACTPETECDGLKQHADFCIPKPLTREIVDRMVGHVFEFFGKKKQ